MRRLLAAAAILALGMSPASAQGLIVTLSTDQVEITSNFNGTGITVFGALQLDALQTHRPYNLVVVLRGPDQPVSIRRKDRVLGLWINRAEATFADLPVFYAIHTTTPLADFATPSSLAALGLGLDAISAGVTGVGRGEFASALVRLRQDEGVYYEQSGAIDWPGANVFRTTFSLPADVPVGPYSVEVLVFQDGQLLASAQQPLAISKTGSEQFIFDASRQQPWLYALAIVMIAAGAGWLGGVVFRKD